MKRNNIVLFISTILILTISAFCKNNEKADIGIVWKHGIAVKDGKALYIDVNKLDQSVMVVTKKSIEEHKKKKLKIIKAGTISWYDDFISVYDTKIDSPSHGIMESEVEYKYKIENNTLYLKKGKDIWDKLYIEIINENPIQPRGRYANPIYLIIQLKCKWFEGEYEVFGASG